MKVAQVCVAHQDPLSLEFSVHRVADWGSSPEVDAQRGRELAACTPLQL